MIESEQKNSGSSDNDNDNMKSMIKGQNDKCRGYVYGRRKSKRTNKLMAQL